MMPALGTLCGHQPFAKAAQIDPAENGFIVTTLHEVEVEMPGPDETGEGWKGGKTVKQPLAKNNVFTDIDEALDHMKKYMKGAE